MKKPLKDRMDGRVVDDLRAGVLGLLAFQPEYKVMTAVLFKDVRIWGKKKLYAEIYEELMATEYSNIMELRLRSGGLNTVNFKTLADYYIKHTINYPEMQLLLMYQAYVRMRVEQIIGKYRHTKTGQTCLEYCEQQRDELLLLDTLIRFLTDEDHEAVDELVELQEPMRNFGRKVSDRKELIASLKTANVLVTLTEMDGETKRELNDNLKTMIATCLRNF